MQRILVPEILDQLTPDDPRAIRSRRDLKRINGIMRQAPIMAAALRQLPEPHTIVDLGSGDGAFLLNVARRLSTWRHVRAVIADRHDIVSGQTRRGFAALGWACEVLAGDIFDTLAGVERGVVITANLFLHHFDEAALARLLALVATRADAFIACEPRRSRPALLASKLVALIGANDVTRHDAVASVRAGFADRELSALWPRPVAPREEVWVLRERPRLPFSHGLIATRHAL